MFSPAVGRSKGRGRDGSSTRNIKQGEALSSPHEEEGLPSSPSTPLPIQQPDSSQMFSSPGSTMISPSSMSRRYPNMAVRASPVIRSRGKSKTDISQPIFVSDVPQELRTAMFLPQGLDKQTALSLGPSARDSSQVCGGMDQITGLSWMVQGTQVFVWRHTSNQSSETLRVLSIPHELCSATPGKIDSKHGNSWAAVIVGRQNEIHKDSIKFSEYHSDASIIICSRKSLAVVYWSTIFSETGHIPVLSLGPEESIERTSVMGQRVPSGWTEAGSTSFVSSMIACLTAESNRQCCVAMACQSAGELWRFDCTSNGISWKKIPRDVEDRRFQGELGQGASVPADAGARSIIWQPKEDSMKAGWRQLLLLTATGIECWDVELTFGHEVQLLWVFDVLADLDSEKALSGQKQVWLLDFQEIVAYRRLKLLLASYSKDRVNGSNYIQYFTLTYSFLLDSMRREEDIQIILPKARIEEENFVPSLQLRVGGKPDGSVMILASDGTATVAHSQGGTMKLYQFDLAWDAGKVIDACVLASSEENEQGSWLVLTERAGVWAIPGKAVLLCGIKSLERSLSCNYSQNEDSGNSVRWHKAVEELAQRVETPEAQMQSLQDVEAETLVGRVFNDYLLTGQTDGVFDKFQQAGAFEKEGATNVFALASKAIVDALPKHWTSSIVTNVTTLTAISSQLAEKQRKHQQFLHFLSASKCHEGLRLWQRSVLHLIMEHGEKLSAIIWLRELHNSSAQARLHGLPNSLMSTDKTEWSELGGAMWELVLLAGEKVRRNEVMLFDRDKAEIFYSRVSDIEDLFLCIHLHSEVIINKDQPVQVQVEKACEIASACSKGLQTAIRYRDSQHTWYPSPEGLTPWYCKPVVRMGLWKLATLILDLKDQASYPSPSLGKLLMSHLEELAEVLLEAYAGAITAMFEREEEYRGLQMEYWSRRDLLLAAIHHHARAFLRMENNEIDVENGDQKWLGALRQAYSSLISLAKRHAGYQALWDICSELKDLQTLQNLMHESMGLREGRFSNFVFEQCYKSKQFAKLLRLGEEVRDEFASFLQNHKDLLWLHELYVQHFALASSTLRWLALSKEPAVTAEVESMQDGLRPSCKMGKLKPAARKRLLNLAKLSALAGGETPGSEKLLDINADSYMLEVQAEAYPLNMVGEEDVLTPRQLVEICLKSDNRNLIVKAFHVFAWNDGIFLRGNKSLFEAAWLKAADQDDWILMRQLSEREGWSDEQHVEALQNTALYQAVKCCYSRECFQRRGSFEDVLPLFQEEVEEGDHRVESLETILMQHRDFPEAGQAMLAAVRIGRCIGGHEVVYEEMDM